MPTIQKLVSSRTGSISYRVQVRVKGSGKHSATFSNIRDARAWATQTEGQIREGRYFPARKAARTTFAELVARYRIAVAPQRKTSGGQRVHLEYWVAALGPKSLAEITPDRIAEARDRLAAEKFRRGKPTKDARGNVVTPKEYSRSGATVNRYVATLRHVFSVASRQWRLVAQNPCDSLDNQDEPRGRSRFLSDPERAALLDACERSEWPALRALALLAITTGARRGELINLRWADVDFKSASAIVHRTKNGEPKVLPLVGKSLDALRELRLRGGGKGEWVFAQPSGHPGPYVHFDKHWYRALDAAGITDFRFHDLRHTCASYLAAHGHSLLEIADVLGHRSLQMVQRYAHLTTDHKHKVLRRMAARHDL